MNVSALARRPARMLRHIPDRVAHRVRRRRARYEVACEQRIDTVVFVCHGNICRSPYAAAAFARQLPEPLRARMQIRSAGLIGPGREAPEAAQAAALRRGIDLSPHRSALIAQNDVGPGDLVVVMEPAQRLALQQQFWVRGRIVVLGDFDPAPIATRAIPDPFGKSVETFADCYQRIDRCIAALLAALEIPSIGRQVT